MSPTLDIGLKSICALSTLAAHAPCAARQIGATTFGLAFMAGFIELACEEAIRPHLAEGARSYGIALRLTRRSEEPAAGDVTITTEIVGMSAGRLGFRFQCRDERGVISTGYHERIVVAAPHKRSAGRAYATAS